MCVWVLLAKYWCLSCFCEGKYCCFSLCREVSRADVNGARSHRFCYFQTIPLTRFWVFFNLLPAVASGDQSSPGAPAEGLFNQGWWWLNRSKSSGCQTVRMLSAAGITLAASDCLEGVIPLELSSPGSASSGHEPGLSPWHALRSLYFQLPPPLWPLIDLPVAGKGDWEETGPSCTELAFKMLSKDGRSSAACHKLFIFSIIHTTLPFISDAF